MSSFNGQNGMRAITPEDKEKNFDEKRINVGDSNELNFVSNTLKIPKLLLEKINGEYYPIRKHKTWKGMYEGLYKDWTKDTLSLRESNNKKELQIIDLELEIIDITVMLCKKLKEEKEKYRMAVIQMREDNEGAIEAESYKDEIEARAYYKKLYKDGKATLKIYPKKK